MRCQSDHIRTFLLQTSILERMSAQLCEAIISRDAATQASELPAATIITGLYQQNLVLIPLNDERRWYRYHHLFADLLRYRLGQEHPTLVAELHRRAARWFEQPGIVAEAVEHALTTNDTG